MNTLSKNITKTFFKSDEGYNQMIARWKELHKENPKSKIEPKYFMLYAILRGKDWRKGFTPCTNQIKLDNGYKPNLRAEEALSAIRSTKYDYIADQFIENSGFNDIIDCDTLEKIRELLPNRDFEDAYKDLILAEAE